MPSLLTRLILLLSSFSPLLIVFALLDSWGKGLPTQICIGLAVVSWCGLFAGKRVATSLNPVELRAAKIVRKDGELLAYIATYFVPFLTVPGDSPRKAAALAVFVLLLGIFYIQGDMYHWNPILGLFRFQILELEVVSGQSVNVITRRKRVTAGSVLSLRPLTPNVYWEID